MKVIIREIYFEKVTKKLKFDNIEEFTVDKNYIKLYNKFNNVDIVVKSEGYDYKIRSY